MSDLCPCCYRPLPPEMDLKVSLEENCVIWMGHRCDLTPTETEIIWSLAEAGRKWMATERLLARVYGAGEYPESKPFTVHVSRIRRKLRDAGIPVTVENSWRAKVGGHAYRLRYGYDKYGAS